MVKRAATFKLTDVSRAAEGVKKAGLEVARVEVDSINGKITVVVGRAEQIQPENEWDSIQ